MLVMLYILSKMKKKLFQLVNDTRTKNRTKFLLTFKLACLLAYILSHDLLQPTNRFLGYREKLILSRN